MTPKHPLFSRLVLTLAAALPAALAGTPPPAAYREPAVFNLTTAKTWPDPGAFTVTFGSPRTEVLIGAEYEPFNFRHRLYAGGDGENTIPLERHVASAYDSWREGFFDGATVRVYRIIDGKFVQVRRDTVKRHRASGWLGTLDGRLVAPDRPTFQWHFEGYNSPVHPWHFAVVAVAADGTRSAPSATVAVMRPEKVGAKAANDNLIAFKPAEGGPGGGAPATPAGFEVSDRGDGVLTFSWSPVPGAAGYQVLRSDQPPEAHAGHGLDLAGEAGDATARIRRGDLVFIDLRRDEYSRSKYNSNRVWGDWASSGLPSVYPGHPGEGDTPSWRLVPHPGPIPDSFPETERGRTCLEIEMTGDKELHLSQYCYASPAQEYYHALVPGRAYVAEFWARQEGMADPTIRFRTTAVYQDEIREDFTIDGEWRKYVYEFTPEAEFPRDNRIVGMMGLRFSGPGKLWLDAFRVYPADGGPRVYHEREVEALRESGMGFLRTHSFIKSNWSYFLDDLLATNGLAGPRGTRGSNNPTLPFVLEFMKRAGVSPWLQIEMSLAEEEWTGLVEYLAAPYDPAVDTPETKPWAWRRHSQGQAAPWTEVFPRFLFEVSNEMWNPHSGFAPWHFPWQQMTDGVTGRVYRGGELAGFITGHVLDQMQKSPYWPALDARMETVVGGWLVQLDDDGFGQAAVRVEPRIKHNLVANYNGGWDEGADAGQATDLGFRQVLTVVPHYLGANIRRFAETRDRLAEKGVHFKIGTYEAGPGYVEPKPGLPREIVEQESLLMKSLAAGTATLDVFLDGATQGMGLQNFFTFSRGRDFWTSHARENRGGQAYPSWLGLSLYNRVGQGDFLAVQTERAPTDDLPGTRTRGVTRNAPLVSAYATRSGDRYTVFLLSRKIDHHPYAGDDGFTPVKLNLPFAKASRITLYTMEGDPRANNLDAENIRIRSRAVNPAVVTPEFTLGEQTGADRRGLPPAATYAYVFEGVEFTEPPPVVATKILPAPGQPVLTHAAEAVFHVYCDRPAPDFPADRVRVTGGAGGRATVTPLPGSADTVHVVRVTDLDGPGEIRVEIPGAGVTGPVVRFTPEPPRDELLAWESFDYPDSLWGEPQGKGWRDKWTLHNVNPARQEETYHVSTQAPFARAATRPYLQAGQRYMSLWRTLDVEGAFSRFVMRPEGGGRPRVGLKGSTVWMSVRVRLDAPEAGARFALGHQAFYQAEGMSVQVGNVANPGSSARYWGLQTRDEANKAWVTALSGVPANPGDEMLLVLRITYGRQDRVDLFVNPRPGAEPPARPDASMTAAPGLDLSFDKLVIWGGAFGDSSFDDIRFGDSFKVVSSSPR